MYRPRIIPVLLLDKDHLVKSVGFKDYNYINLLFFHCVSKAFN